MEILVTIVTPSYNRAHTLERLYKSLLNQGNKAFNWLIVDDGSTDNTEEVVNSFLKNSPFKICYTKKKNGGKHTALNLAFETVDTRYTFIVDSDDCITDDAVQSIYDADKTVMENNLAGVAFLKGYDKEKTIGVGFSAEGIFNDIDVRIRQKIHGDKAEVWRSDILKKYRFPEFEGERFQGENYVWWRIALEYDMLYINKIVYIAEYLPEGLSKAGKKLRISCPLGGMENSKTAFDSRFPLRERIKRAWLYICYGLFAKKSIWEIIKSSERWQLIVSNLPFGILLYIYWNYKYNR